MNNQYILIKNNNLNSYLPGKYDRIDDMKLKDYEPFELAYCMIALEADTEEEAKNSEMYYVSNRWLGGLLTNFETVKKSIRRLGDIEKMEEEAIIVLTPSHKLLGSVTYAE